MHSYFPSDERWLRPAMRLPAGERLTTPVLCLPSTDGDYNYKSGDKEWLPGGLAIGRWACAAGGDRLPVGAAGTLAAAEAAVDGFMAGGRVRSFTRVLERKAYADEAFPPAMRRITPWLPAALKRRLSWGVFSFTLNKYQAQRPVSYDDAGVAMRAGLAQIEALRAGRDHFDGGRLSLIDVFVAGSLGWLAECPAPRSFEHGTTKLAFFEGGAMAKEFKDLIAWRDAIYAKRSNGVLPLA